MKYNEQELALLDMFAGQALSGLASSVLRGNDTEAFANSAYSVAEAMLEYRRKFIE